MTGVNFRCEIHQKLKRSFLFAVLRSHPIVRMHPLPRRKCDFNWKSIPRTIKLSFFNSHENFSPLSTHNQDSFSMQSHNFNLKFERCSAHKSMTTLDLWKIAYDNWKRHLLDCRWRRWNKWEDENRVNCGFCHGDTRPLIGKKCE